jgi:hypothetical protein
VSACELGVGKAAMNDPVYTVKQASKKTSINNNSNNIAADVTSENQSFMINFREEFTGNVSIFDLSGKRISSVNFAQAKGGRLIDGLNLASGLYLVHFETNDKTEIKKVIYNNQ